MKARMTLEQCARSCAAATRRAAATSTAAALAGPRGSSRLRRRDFFAGTESNRLFADWIPSTLGANESLRWSLATLRARGEDVGRNNPYGVQFLRMLGVNVVGHAGVKHQAQVRNNDGKLNKPFNDRIEEGWADWSLSPMIDGSRSRVRLEHGLIRRVAAGGEALVRMWRGFDDNPYRFALEEVDPRQLDETLNQPRGDRQNEITMGVEVNQYGRPLAYHLWRGAQGRFSDGPRERVPADQIIHLFDATRPNQRRGVTWLNPIMMPLMMLQGYVEAELTNSRVSAAKCGFFQKKAGEDGEVPEGDEDGKITMEASPGQFEFLPPGFELADWTPDHPSTAFGAFVKGILQQIATGLGTSYNALANDLEGVNYSSMRSGLLIEREVWKELQQWWIDSFYRRVYVEWLNHALLSGQLTLDMRDFRKLAKAKWTPRGWDWVDPLKDSQAGVLNVQSGLDSRTRLLADRGRDFEEVLEELKAEAELAAEYGVDISGPSSASQQKAATTTDAGDAEDEQQQAEREVVRLTNRLRQLRQVLIQRNGHHEEVTR